MIFSSILLMMTFSPVASPAALSDSQMAFYQEIQKLCGSRFEGYSTFPDDPEDPFTGKLLVAVVKSCEKDQIRISFAVGEDTSRTWVITKSKKGLLLKHDHRHEDGTPHEVTMYGGWANQKGTATSQFFASDAHTTKLIPAAATNVWNIQLDTQAKTITYYLERHEKPRFKAVLKLVASK